MPNFTIPPSPGATLPSLTGSRAICLASRPRLEAEGKLSRLEARILGSYVVMVGNTFRALSYKYLMSGRIDGPLPGRLTFDRHESGFPIAQELMVMAVDAHQAEKHLAGMASEAELKDRMIRQIVGEQAIPTQLQFALSQRLYYETLKAGGLFWARNDPDAQWLQEAEWSPSLSDLLGGVRYADQPARRLPA